MAERDVDYLLIGGGVASAQCAAELRRGGAEGSIMLVGREPHPPYDRPPLSKAHLRGEHPPEDAYVHSEAWYVDNEVELLTATSVVGLDLESRTAKLPGKLEVGFERALIATGAMVNILRVDGAQLDGIHYLRAFGNSDRIREDVAEAEHVVLIGGSYIGTEVAASLTEMGKRCTIVMLEEVTLAGPFGAEVGRYFQELLISKGIEIVGGEMLEAFLGDERVSGIRTASGREISCDAVVVGAGVKPDVMLAGRAGLETEGGVHCDAGLETSVEGVFAAGDCARWDSRRFGPGLRIEHWDVAFQQGRHVARAMLGEKADYEVIPYFFSDLSDWASLSYVGHAPGWDRLVLRGALDEGSFSAWYLRDGVVDAALSVGRGEDLPQARRLIDSEQALADPRGLADPDSDLSAIGA
jgi:3-phenylpropionate/trans-cinnamate dioxygenase ferredoxin reductase subunit